MISLILFQVLKSNKIIKLFFSSLIWKILLPLINGAYSLRFQWKISMLLCNRLIKTFCNNCNSNDFTIIQLHVFSNIMFCYQIKYSLFCRYICCSRHRNVNIIIVLVFTKYVSYKFIMHRKMKEVGLFLNEFTTLC